MTNTNPQNGICKTTKRERRKKFDKFKDKLHGMFGPTMVTGIGEPQPYHCDLCGEIVHMLIIKHIKGKIVQLCRRCKNIRCSKCDKEDILKKMIVNNETLFLCPTCRKNKNYLAQ